jgi:hypothetical protein
MNCPICTLSNLAQAEQCRLRLYALGTELAFAKHKSKIDAAHANVARIDALRSGIAQVKAARAWELVPSV